MRGQDRMEYARKFVWLADAPGGPLWENRDNGVVRVVPPRRGQGPWVVHAGTTTRRGESHTTLLEPKAEERAFALAAGIISNLFAPKPDD